MEVPVYFEDLVVGSSFLSDEVAIDHDEMLAYNRRNDSVAISRRRGVGGPQSGTAA